jgi:hypothetical protein
MPPKAENIRAQTRIPTNSPRFDARAVLQWLAKPRLTGSDAAAGITAQLREQFVSLGYEVREYPFSLSTWPGRFGMTAAGAVYLAGSVMAAALLFNAHPGVALVVQLTVLLLVAAIAVLARPAISVLPWGRVEGINLIAHAPGKRPRYYLMAHRDSKSQPVPLAFRGPAIVLGIIAWAALSAAAAAALIDPVYRRSELAIVLGVFAAIAGVILVFCWVDNRSPGALDNASGVAALLGVAERELQAGDVAFIITDAEELGLAGARAIAPVLPPSFGVINVDGLDDHGGYYVLERFGWPRKRGSAPPLAAALLSAAESVNAPARRRDVPLGLLLDHIPLVRAGTPALTLMRGSLKSLRRVHRPADNLDNLSGSGVNEGVALLSEALRILRQQT